MKKLNKILFFADGAKGEKKALSSALELAAHASAELSIVSYVQVVSSNDPGLRRAISEAQSALVKERIDLINALLAEVDATQKVSVQVEPAEKTFVSLIRKAVDDKFDLIVKAADKRGAVGTAIFGSLDQRLLRQCPAPVWLIKPGQKKIRKVLASVDLSTDDKKMASLAKRIVEFAQGVASVEKAELHVLTIWEHEASAFRGQIDATMYDRLMESLKQEIAGRFGKLLARHKGVHQHFLRGEPDQVISRFVTKNDIDLVVMGTLSRSGVPGLLIGNTAERLLGQVDCSVLTLKPAGFKTVLTKGR